jgi:hypothetical protein
VRCLRTAGDRARKRSAAGRMTPALFAVRACDEDQAFLGWWSDRVTKVSSA